MTKPSESDIAKACYIEGYQAAYAKACYIEGYRAAYGGGWRSSNPHYAAANSSDWDSGFVRAYARINAGLPSEYPSQYDFYRVVDGAMRKGN